jgi:hypothetical protein
MITNFRRINSAIEVNSVYSAMSKSYKKNHVIDNYYERLIKLIPTEIIGAYLALDNVLVSSNAEIIYRWALIIILVFVTPLNIFLTTKKGTEKTATSQIIISSLSFLVWVYTLGGPFKYFGFYKPFQGTFILVLFTMISSWITKSANQNGR